MRSKKRKLYKSFLKDMEVQEGKESFFAKKFPFPPAKILYLDQIVVDTAGNGINFFLDWIKFEFFAEDYGTDECWNRKSGDD